MDITRVVVRPVQMDKVKAMASVTFDDAFVVHGIRVVDGEKGLFVAMPSRRLPSGEYRDVAHPINTETREVIQDAVLKEFKEGGAAEAAAKKEEAKSEPSAEEPASEEPASEESADTKDESPDLEGEKLSSEPAEETSEAPESAEETTEAPGPGNEASPVTEEEGTETGEQPEEK